VEAIAPRAAAIEPWLFDFGAWLKRAVRRSLTSALEKRPVSSTGPGPNLPS
jgi:hypothetical protein